MPNVGKILLNVDGALPEGQCSLGLAALEAGFKIIGCLDDPHAAATAAVHRFDEHGRIEQGLSKGGGFRQGGVAIGA